MRGCLRFARAGGLHKHAHLRTALRLGLAISPSLSFFRSLFLCLSLFFSSASFFRLRRTCVSPLQDCTGQWPWHACRHFPFAKRSRGPPSLSQRGESHPTRQNRGVACMSRTHVFGWARRTMPLFSSLCSFLQLAYGSIGHAQCATVLLVRIPLPRFYCGASFSLARLDGMPARK